MSTFNPTQLMNTEVTGALDTTIIPIPEGDWNGVAEKFEFRQADSKDKSTTYTFLEVTWSFNDSEIEVVTMRDKNTARQSMILDLTPTGNLDMSKGKNVGLGRLREALGQNDAGKPWAFGMITGGVALCSVKHRVTDAGDIIPEVRKVAAL